jgi:deoxyribose-phosphate aldolase
MTVRLDRVGLLAITEHTLLDPAADRRRLEQFLAEARRLGPFAVCVAPLWVAAARDGLAESDIRLVTVAGFPHGTSTPRIKAAEAAAAVEEGAAEVDMVMSAGQLRSGGDRAVVAEIAAVVRACAGLPVKVIVEAAQLTDAERRRAAVCCRDGGAAFVKTSTGFGPGGATPEDVRLLAAASGLPVKAAGGIRTLAQAEALVAAGARRLGMSRTADLLAELGPADA